MKNKTTRLLRILSDIRHAQRCTALRAAAASAEIDAVLAEPAEPEAKQDTGPDSDDGAITLRARIGLPH